MHNYMSLLLHNVTINENLSEYGFSLIELFDDSLSSHNFINSVAKHQVEFRWPTPPDFIL